MHHPLRNTVLIAGGWAFVFAVVAAQEAVGSFARGRGPEAGAIADAGILLLLWALATPLVFRSVARWPVRGAVAARHALLHAALGAGFVLLLNVLIRTGALLEQGAPFFAQSLTLGLVRYGPLALLVYGVLVGLGHAVHRPAPAAARNGRRLTLQNGSGRVVMDPAEIDWIEARDNYVRIHTRGRASLVRERISALERRLDRTQFIRIHRSAIVAVRAVREVRPRSHGDAVVALRTGEELRLTRTRRAALERALSEV